MSTTDQAETVAIIERHYNMAWRIEMSTRMMSERGRRTKAKDHAADIAHAKAEAIRAIVNDLRKAGYTITEV